MLRGYHMARNDDKVFRATTTPEVKPPRFNMDFDISGFHRSIGHIHEGLLRETTKQRNFNVTGTLRAYQGCSIVKRRVKPIFATTGTQAANPGCSVHLEVCGEKSVQSLGGKKYMLITRCCLVHVQQIRGFQIRQTVPRRQPLYWCTMPDRHCTH